jgi:hypothetical protein
MIFVGGELLGGNKALQIACRDGSLKNKLE